MEGFSFHVEPNSEGSYEFESKYTPGDIVVSCYFSGVPLAYCFADIVHSNNVVFVNDIYYDDRAQKWGLIDDDPRTLQCREGLISANKQVILNGCVNALQTHLDNSDGRLQLM
jgi:hypothetical protein